MNDIPIIDLDGLSTRDPLAMARMTGEVAHACREVGFFYVQGHGVPQAILDAVMVQSRAFFAQPLAKKNALKISADSDNKGYVGLRTEAMTRKPSTSASTGTMARARPFAPNSRVSIL